jgi:hypothetical protein
MGDWVYLFNQDALEDSFYGQSTRDFSAAAVDLVANSMAARYAVAAGEDGMEPILVRVDAIAGYADYRQVLEYFENIEIVDTAWPAYVEGDSVVFRLVARADSEQLQRIIALNRRLLRQSAPAPLERGPIDLALFYEWSP